MSDRLDILTASGTWRFVQRGLADLERRVARIAVPASSRDVMVIRLLEGSLLVRAVERVVAAVVAAAATSRSVHALRAALASEREQPIAARWRLAGIAVLAAVISHLLFSILGDRPTGWAWLILPAIAATIGLVLAAVSPTSTSGSR